MASRPLSREELRAARLRNLGIATQSTAESTASTASTASPAVDSCRQAAQSSPLLQLSQRELQHDEFEELCDVLYRNSGFVTGEDLDRWCDEGFRFCAKPNFGLMQGHGGPCGVLAAVQAEIFRVLFFDDRFAARGVDRHSFPDAVDAALVRAAFVAALLDTLRRGLEEGDPIQLVTLREDVSPLSARHFQTWRADGLRVTSFATDEAFERAFTGDDQRLPVAFESGAGCLLFLLSCVMTRGLRRVRSDMASDPTSSFIGQFGHCNQETLNLLLAGRATSLVLDGSQTLDASLALCGIPHQTDIGYLSTLEAARYVTVGRYLKRPRAPVWVLGGASHFTVLCALDAAVNAESPEELLLETMRRAFKAEDSDGTGFIPSASLRAVLERVSAEAPNAALAQLLRRSAAGDDSVELSRLRGLCQVDGEIVLWQGFWTLTSQLLTGRATLDELSSRQPPQSASMDVDDAGDTRPRSDSDYARMLQAEFDDQQRPAPQQPVTPAPTGLGALDFSALLGLGAAQSGAAAAQPAALRRSDSEIARELQSQFDLELDGAATTATVAVRDAAAEPTAPARPVAPTDAVASDADVRFRLWHFNGLQGGVLREVQLLRRRENDCVGQPVALEASDGLGLSDGRSLEDLLRTRWPGCALRWEGPEPKLE